MYYAYIRVSSKTQSIQRQIENIAAYAAQTGAAVDRVYSETYTGTKIDRPEWNKLMKVIQSGDTIIFDSVSRMSRNADEGINAYMELYNKGVNLVFLKEHQIDTETYKKTLHESIPMTGTDVDFILEGVNKFLLSLAAKQIKIAFDQADKEVKDLHQRTAEGMRAKGAGQKIAEKHTGMTYNGKKKAPAKEIIRKHYEAFGGTLNATETAKQCGISRATLYRYIEEIEAETKQ